MGRSSDTLARLGVPPLPVRRIFGMEVLAATLEEIAGVAEAAIARRQRLITGQLNGPTLVRMYRDAELYAAIAGADILFADGAGVVQASRLFGRPLPERVAGIDLMHRLLHLADARGLRVFLLGAEAAVLTRVEEILRRRYPRAIIAGARDGFYAAGEEPAIAREIAESRADILFVAMSTPKKELFIARHGDATGAPVLHGVGGAFDVVAGKVRRAPDPVQRLSLEWAYRIYQEPQRMWRREGLANALFAGIVAWHLLAERLRPEG